MPGYRAHPSPSPEVSRLRTTRGAAAKCRHCHGCGERLGIGGSGESLPTDLPDLIAW